MFRVMNPALHSRLQWALLIAVLLAPCVLQAQGAPACKPEHKNVLKKASCEGPVRCDLGEAKKAAHLVCAQQKCTGDHDPKCPVNGKCEKNSKCLPYIPNGGTHEKKVPAPDCKDKMGWQVTLEGDLECTCECKEPGT
jgi:hypothetical protein